MFVLIVEHDHSEWDVTLHTDRKAAEHHIGNLANDKYFESDESWQPNGVADWIEYLAEHNEYVKLFHADPDTGFGEGINFGEDEASKRAA